MKTKKEATNTTVINVYLDEETKKLWRELARQDDRSMSGFISAAVTSYIAMNYGTALDGSMFKSTHGGPQRITVTFLNDEYKLIESAARRSDRTVAQYVRKAATLKTSTDL